MAVVARNIAKVRGGGQGNPALGSGAPAIHLIFDWLEWDAS